MSSIDVHEFHSRLADVASGQAPVIALSKSRGRLGPVALLAAIALVHVVGLVKGWAGAGNQSVSAAVAGMTR